MSTSRDSPRRRSSIQCGGSSGCRSLVAENSARALHCRQNSSAVCFARSLPLCHTTPGFAPRAAAAAARRSTATRPAGVSGRRGFDVWTGGLTVVDEKDSHRASWRTIACQVSRMAEASRPVGGWLVLLCRLLLVYQPLSLALSASAALNSFPTRGPRVLVAIAIRVFVTGVNVAAGLALTNRAPSAVRLAHRAGTVGRLRYFHPDHVVLSEQSAAGRHTRSMSPRRCSITACGLATSRRSSSACGRPISETEREVSYTSPMLRTTFPLALLA